MKAPSRIAAVLVAAIWVTGLEAKPKLDVKNGGAREADTLRTLDIDPMILKKQRSFKMSFPVNVKSAVTIDGVLNARQNVDENLNVVVEFPDTLLFNKEAERATIRFVNGRPRLTIQSKFNDYALDETWSGRWHVVYTLRSFRKDKSFLDGYLSTKLFVRNAQPAALVRDEAHDPSRAGKAFVEVTLHKQRGFFPVRWLGVIDKQRVQLPADGSPLRIAFDMHGHQPKGDYFARFRIVRYDGSSKTPKLTGRWFSSDWLKVRY